MNRNWDTPPDGDFVRYLERLTSPAPGAVVRGAPRAVRPGMQPAPGAVTPQPRQQARPAQAPRAAPPGPPDLGTIFRQVFSVLTDEIKKNTRR